jgi:hypothetical protein
MGGRPPRRPGFVLAGGSFVFADGGGLLLAPLGLVVEVLRYRE